MNLVLLLFFFLEHIWLLTRERTPSKELILKLRKIVEERGFDLNILVTTNQNDCEIN